MHPLSGPKRLETDEIQQFHARMFRSEALARCWNMRRSFRELVASIGTVDCGARKGQVMCVPRIVETVACLKVKVRRLSQFGIESRKGTYGHAFPSKGMAPGRSLHPPSTLNAGHPVGDELNRRCNCSVSTSSLPSCRPSCLPSQSTCI